MAKKKINLPHITIELDKKLENADWTKKTWDLPPYKSEKFMEMLKNTGFTLEQFKKLPVYRWAVERGEIKEE